ncbi:hypothetical protein [Xanthobacter sp. VNH20]|uniref:hypothetical protein n=1 Tax=Xanthobacter sp. VNH20 TaxID=3156616 RepID=UPI0032B5582E
MRNLTLAAFAIGAALTVSGAASADEYVTALNKEAYAVAAESAREAPATDPFAVAPLGYAATPTASHPLNAIFPAQNAQPTTMNAADRAQLHIGNRGIGGAAE